jgi:hypothetical protein
MSCFVFYAFLPFFRITNFWFLTLLSPREDNSRLILLLVTLKPSRLRSARKEMMPWILKKIVALLHHLLLPSLEIKVWRRKGNALMILFPQLPPL